jgi:hypothetical protein
MIRLKPALFKTLKESHDPRDGILNALQAALQLEHATIPLYLYARYSLDAARNQAIADIIDSVVTEEMLHMALVCNLINALGGTPVIANAATIPKFPGPLPGSVHGELILHLAPFGESQLTAFLEIEEPENGLTFPTGLLAVVEPHTIGRFYAQIIDRIAAAMGAGVNVFVGDATRQVTQFVPGVIPVTDIESAKEAIALIVEQGEGTAQSPLEALDADQFAHYYKFQSIAKGYTLTTVPNAKPDDPVEQRYAYAGEPISFDKRGVFPLPVDPHLSDYEAGSAERSAIKACNDTYSDILRSLESGFSGAQGSLYDAINLMRSFDVTASALAQGRTVQGVYLGPTFEFID